MDRALIRSPLLCHISLLALSVVEAQGQAPGSRSRTSAVGTLFPDTSAAAPATPAPPAAPGALRQLVCRGNAGTHIVVEQKPSPRSSGQVAVGLAYRRNPAVAGSAYEKLEPGACSWTPYADAGIPPEPGVVHFDLDPVGSEFVANPESMAAWMADPGHYWSFFVDDKSNVSISHGPYGAQFRSAPTTRDKPEKSTAASLRREQLRCRGGRGYEFAQSRRLGPNLVAVQLSYRVAKSQAGRLGRGLEPGTCAWDDRTNARAEPGQIVFTAPGNAQLKQQQSGSEVDRSPTAAERWPDVHTIPPYLNDPAHYWTFTVSLANPDSALHHKAWKPAVEVVETPPPAAGAPPSVEGTAAGGGGAPGVVGAKPPAGTGTRVSLPGGSTVGERYDPGASTTFDPSQVFDIRNVQVRTGLDGVSILFDAGPNLAPTVFVSTTAPSGSSGSYSFGGQPVRLTVQGTAVDGGHWHYTAASTTPLARGTRYWFIADAPAGANSRPNQATGEFRTLRQSFKLGISHIDIISDGDNDSPGDFWFRVVSCPNELDQDIIGDHKTTVEWSEGRHPVGAEVETDPASSVPDRIRIFIVGNDDDGWILSGYGASSPYYVYWICDKDRPDGSLIPYSTSKAEWNAAVLDLDLGKMAGATATQTFIKRSQPLRNGTKVAFEVRGYYSVTRE
jgi:hypothetical protein